MRGPHYSNSPACSCVSITFAKSDASIEDVYRPRCDFGFTHPLHRLSTGREGLKRLQNRQTDLPVQLPVVVLTAHHVFDRTPIGDVQHLNEYLVAADGFLVRWVVPGAERGPLIGRGHAHYAPLLGEKSLCGERAWRLE